MRTITRFYLEATPQISAEENSRVLQEHVLGAVRTLGTTALGPKIQENMVDLWTFPFAPWKRA